ncbi:MAG: hydrogenase maturation protease [Acidobacteriota bacterium]|nr:hydrogenase maturation protease [Acidobacteriota bacterium]
MTSDELTAIAEDTSSAPSILVAGIGNIFMGDDAFGCEVARRLAGRQLPEGVRVVDFGIRGFDLAYAIMDGPDVTVFVDATPRGEAPGTLYTIEPDLDELNGLEAGGIMVEPHGMNPLKVLGMVKAMGGEFKRILLVGCEPETLGGEEGLMGLSEPVEQAVDEAVKVVESLIAKILEESRAQAVS